MGWCYAKQWQSTKRGFEGLEMVVDRELACRINDALFRRRQKITELARELGIKPDHIYMVMRDRPCRRDIADMVVKALELEN